jgi:hypothetical protein
MYQLCLGSRSFASVVDRLVLRCCAVAPGIDPGACRQLAELVFAARVRKTEACGAHAECRPGPPVWDGALPFAGETCGWTDLDPEGVPEMFGVAAAALVEGARRGCPHLEGVLADAMRDQLAQLLFHNPRCGHAAVCHASPVFPLPTRR